MDSETPAQTAPLIADFNPYTKGDEIDWKKSPGNPFEKRSGILAAREQIFRILSMLPPENRGVLGHSIFLSEKPESLAYLVELEQAGGMSPAVNYPAFMAASNFYLIPKVDRMDLMSSLYHKIRWYPEYFLPNLIKSLTPIASPELEMAGLIFKGEIVLPEAISPLSYDLTHFIFKDKELIEIVCKSGTEGVKLLIIAGMIHGFFDDEVSSLDARRVLTPFILKNMQRDEFNKPYILDLIVNPLRTVDSRKLKMVKHFVSDSFLNVAAARLKEPPQTLSEVQIWNRAEAQISAQYANPFGEKYKSDDVGIVRERAGLIKDRQAELAIIQEQAARLEESTRLMAEASRQKALAGFSTQLREILRRYEAEDIRGTPVGVDSWYLDSYLARVFDKSVISQARWKTLIQSIVSEWDSQSRSGLRVSAAEFLKSWGGEDSFKKYILTPIAARERVVNGEKNTTIRPDHIASFFEGIESPVLKYVFFAALLEKGFIVGRQDQLVDELFLQRFKQIISLALKQEHDEVPTFQAHSVDTSEVHSPEKFAEVEAQSLARIANLDPSKGLVGLNNPQLQEELHRRLEFARLFNAEIKKQGVSIGVRTSLEKSRELAYGLAPPVLAIVSAILVISALSQYDQATVEQLLSQAPALIPALGGALLYKSQPASMLRKYFRPDYFSPHVERRNRSWYVAANKLTRQREEELHSYLKALILFVLAVLATSGFFTTQLNEKVQEFGDTVGDVVWDLLIPDSQVGSDLRTNPAPGQGVAATPYPTPTRPPGAQDINPDRGENGAKGEDGEDPAISESGENSGGFSSDLLPQNRSELGESGEPGDAIFRFRYSGENPPSFWIRDVFDIGSSLENLSVLPPETFVERMQGGTHFTYSQQEYDENLQRRVDEGYLIRENTNVGDGFFEIPEGFNFHEVVVLNYSAPGSGLVAQSSGLFSGVRFRGAVERIAVIYTERRDPRTLGESQYLRISSSTDIIPDQEYESLSEYSPLRQMVEFAREMQTAGVSTSVALARLKSDLAARGIDYGFADFDPEQFTTHIQLAEALLNEPELICNQFSWVLAVIMKEAGYENIFLARGFASYGQEGYGGFRNDAHQVILFVENGFLYLFDATLPDADQLQQLRQMTVEEREEYQPPMVVEQERRNNLLKVGVTAGAAAGAAAGALAFARQMWRKRGRNRRKARRTSSVVERLEEPAPLPEELVVPPESLAEKQVREAAEELLRMKTVVAKAVFEAFYFIAEFYKKQGKVIWSKPEDLAQDIGYRMVGKFLDVEPKNFLFYLDIEIADLGKEVQQKLIEEEGPELEALETFILPVAIYSRLLRKTLVGSDVGSEYPAFAQDSLLSDGAEISRTAEGIRIVRQILDSPSLKDNVQVQEAKEMLNKILQVLETPKNTQQTDDSKT